VVVPRALRPSKAAGLVSWEVESVLPLESLEIADKYRVTLLIRIEKAMMAMERGPMSKCPVEQVTGGQVIDPQVTVQSGQLEEKPPNQNKQPMAPKQKERIWLDPNTT